MSFGKGFDFYGFSNAEGAERIWIFRPGNQPDTVFNFIYLLRFQQDIAV